MGITGGFGMVMDMERGTMRRWVCGRDGVKRWADNNEPVEKRTMLPSDVARCSGVGDDIDGWRDGCEHCLRRTAESTGDIVANMAPPPIIAFECEYLIET